MTKRCDTCEMWVEKSTEPAIDILRLGDCHRYPPTPFLGAETEEYDGLTTSFYPQTYADDWCGEYKFRKT